MSFTNLKEALEKLQISEAELKQKVKEHNLQVFMMGGENGEEKTICFKEEEINKLAAEDSASDTTQTNISSQDDLTYDIPEDDENIELDLDDDIDDDLELEQAETVAQDIDLSDDGLDLNLDDDAPAELSASEEDDLDLDLDLGEEDPDTLSIDDIPDDQDFDTEDTLSLDDDDLGPANDTLSLDDDMGLDTLSFDGDGDEDISGDTLSLDENDLDSEDTLSFDVSDSMELSDDSFSLDGDEDLTLDDDDLQEGIEDEDDEELLIDEDEEEAAPVSAPVTKIVEERSVGFGWPFATILCFIIMGFTGSIFVGLIYDMKLEKGLSFGESFYKDVTQFVKDYIEIKN